MAAAVLGLVALGGGLLLLARAKKKPATSAVDAQSAAIGKEIATLPAETQQFILRLLLTDDPDPEFGGQSRYVAASLQMTQLGLTATAAKLNEIMAQREAEALAGQRE